MLITQVTAQGEEHGLINTLANSVKDNDFKHMSKSNREKAKKLKEEEAKMVKVRYINHQENQYGKLEKPYCRWAGDSIKMYKFLSGQEYEVPRGLVNEVNDTFLKKRGDSIDNVTGKVTTHERAPQRVHEFVSVAFS